MPASSLEVLLFSQNSQHINDLQKAFGSSPVHIRFESQSAVLPALVEEDNFDIFICQTETVDARISQIIHKLRAKLPVLFIALITGQSEIPKTLPVHYLLPLETLDRQDELRIHINNIFNLTNLHKRQADLSGMLLHDLRSPAQSIIGYIELLEQEVFGEVSEGQRQILLSALSLGDSIIELMEELGQVYQFEKNQFELLKLKVNLNQFMDETLRALWIQADRKNIKFIPKIAPDLPEISMDTLAIQRVLNNLIHNAVKFSPENGTVQISVQTLEEKEIEFRVIDSGPGLLDDQIPFVFNKFFRILDYKHKQKGQGLGLYICKLIIEAHSGTIEAENNPGGGTTFIFTLPI